ncbi:hypothetical protein NMY22_g12261 [Coprinellus aureogranulatus]|nr:hypothetical protein NMY22_g12261 [Coprinellus aureogranulatus]
MSPLSSLSFEITFGQLTQLLKNAGIDSQASHVMKHLEDVGIDLEGIQNSSSGRVSTSCIPVAACGHGDSDPYRVAAVTLVEQLKASTISGHSTSSSSSSDLSDPTALEFLGVAVQQRQDTSASLDGVSPRSTPALPEDQISVHSSSSDADYDWYCVTIGRKVGAVRGWDDTHAFTTEYSHNCQYICDSKEEAIAAFIAARHKGEVSSATGEVLNIPGLTRVPPGQKLANGVQPRESNKRRRKGGRTTH